MSHRIREAMNTEGGAPFGQGGGTVEVDETYVGKGGLRPHGHRGGHHKNKVLSLVDRNTGRAKSVVVQTVNAKTLLPILRKNIAEGAHVMTDDAKWYKPLSLAFAKHDAVNHSKYEYVHEYVRPTDRHVHTNTIEGFFSIFKRGMRGIYQHCSKDHLHRYLHEFDFRYSNRIAVGVNNTSRADRLLKGVVGKRLMYQTSA
jgi:transposase-like protein